MDATQLEWAIPIFAFGDEGTALRKTNAMVLGWEPILGQGTQLNVDDGVHEGEDWLQLLNFVGSTWRTRLLYACMHSKVYRKKPDRLEALMTEWAADLHRLQREGLRVQYGAGEVTVRLICLGFKGDLPALRKCGNLTRHFLRETVPHGPGMCHLCMANTSCCPAWHTWDWTETLGDDVFLPPFAAGQESAMTRDIHGGLAKARFWLPDPFHTFHKGVHAELAGSAIAARLMTWHA